MECNVCGRTFTKSGDYHRQVRGHNEEKHYSCGKCNKTFKRKDNAHRHEANCEQQPSTSGGGITRKPFPATTQIGFKIMKTQTTYYMETGL